MPDRQPIAAARDILACHGYRADDLEFLGCGEQSACYGAEDIAVLVAISDRVATPDLLGHVVWRGEQTITRNAYPTLQRITNRAADAGVATPRILAVGDEPLPYALIERGHGTPANDHRDLDTRQADWFEQLGAQIRTTHRIGTTGFGMFTTGEPGVTTGEVQALVGSHPTWRDFLDDWLAVYLCVGDARPEDERVLEFLLSQRVVTENDLAVVADRIRDAQAWSVESVLTHYDNRPNNVLVDGGRVTMLDWDLSCAGIGIGQEMIKLFESGPMNLANPRVAGFLHGYGLSDTEAEDAMAQGQLMLVMDGLAMSYGWADQPERLGAVRGWLQSIKKISGAW